MQAPSTANTFIPLLPQVENGHLPAVEFLLVHVLERRLTDDQRGELRGRCVRPNASAFNFASLFQVVLDLQDNKIDLDACVARLRALKNNKGQNSAEVDLFLATIQVFYSKEEAASEEATCIPLPDQLMESRSLCLGILNDKTATPLLKQLVKLPLAKVYTHLNVDIADASVEEKRAADPSQLLSDVCRSTEVGPAIQAQGHLLYGKLLESGLCPTVKKNVSQANAVYKQIIALPAPSSLKAEAKFRSAEIYRQQAQKKPDEEAQHSQVAFKLYNEVIDDSALPSHYLPAVKVHCARILRVGKGVIRDHKLALKLYLEALEFPLVVLPALTVEAKYGCAIIYSEGKDGVLLQPKQALNLGREIIQNNQAPAFIRIKMLKCCALLCEVEHPQEAFNYYKELLELDQIPKDIQEHLEKLTVLAAKLARYHDMCYYLSMQGQLAHPKTRSDLLSFIPPRDLQYVDLILEYHFLIKNYPVVTLNALKQRMLPKNSEVMHLTVDAFLKFFMCDDWRHYTDTKHLLLKTLTEQYPSFSPFLPSSLEELEHAGALFFDRATKLYEQVRKTEGGDTDLEQQAYRLFREVPIATTVKASSYEALFIMLFHRLSLKMFPQNIFAKMGPFRLEAQAYLLDLEMGRYPLDQIKPGALNASIDILNRALTTLAEKCEQNKEKGGNSLKRRKVETAKLEMSDEDT